MFLCRSYIIFPRKLVRIISLRFRVFQLSKLLVSNLAVPSNAVLLEKFYSPMYDQFFNLIIQFPTNCSQSTYYNWYHLNFPHRPHSFYFAFQVIILFHFLYFFFNYSTASWNCDVYNLTLLFLL